MSDPLIPIVGDATHLRAIVSHVLESAGYEVVIAADGAEVPRCFEEIKPDLVVLDGRLRDSDGFEVCRRLRAMPQSRNIPILLCTERAVLSTIASGSMQARPSMCSSRSRWKSSWTPPMRS